MEKIITGEWDGQPIWRQKTAHDKLAEELNKPMSNPQSSDELYEQRKIKELEEKEYQVVLDESGLATNEFIEIKR